MTADTDQPTLAVTSSPASIWLSPICDDTAHHGEGRTWAAPAPDNTCECDVGGHPWVEYVRDDLTRTTHEPRPAGDLREANDRLIEAADYLIDRYQAMSRGKVVRDLAEAEAGYDVAKDMMSLALATHSPAPMAGEGWQDIATLTEADGYVVGWAERSDGCTDREHFIGRKYDIRTNAIINEWTGRWRVVSHWQALTRPAAAHPSTQEG